MAGDVRVKLEIAQELASEALNLKGLQRSWYKPSAECNTIADVTNKILVDLQLQQHVSSFSVMLCIDGFTLPGDGPADLLRDGDHVILMSKDASSNKAAAMAPGADLPAAVPAAKKRKGTKQRAADPATKEPPPQAAAAASRERPAKRRKLNKQAVTAAMQTGDAQQQQQQQQVANADAAAAAQQPQADDPAAAALGQLTISQHTTTSAAAAGDGVKPRSRSARRKALKRKLRRTGVLPKKPKKAAAAAATAGANCNASLKQQQTNQQQQQQGERPKRAAGTGPVGKGQLKQQQQQQQQQGEQPKHADHIDPQLAAAEAAQLDSDSTAAELLAAAVTVPEHYSWAHLMWEEMTAEQQQQCWAFWDQQQQQQQQGHQERQRQRKGASGRQHVRFETDPGTAATAAAAAAGDGDDEDVDRLAAPAAAAAAAAATSVRQRHTVVEGAAGGDRSSSSSSDDSSSSSSGKESLSTSESSSSSSSSSSSDSDDSSSSSSSDDSSSEPDPDQPGHQAAPAGAQQQQRQPPLVSMPANTFPATQQQQQQPPRQRTTPAAARAAAAAEGSTAAAAPAFEGDTSAVDLSRCPALLRPPCGGDILAYQMLEIGADRTPQVSELRQGMVLSYDPTSSTLHLAAWPDMFKHPLQAGIDAARAAAVAAAAADEDAAAAAGDAAAAEILMMSAYDEAGTLTANVTDFVTLLLVRPAETAPANEGGLLPSQKQQQQHIASSMKHVNYPDRPQQQQQQVVVDLGDGTPKNVKPGLGPPRPAAQTLSARSPWLAAGKGPATWPVPATGAGGGREASVLEAPVKTPPSAAAAAAGGGGGEYRGVCKGLGTPNKPQQAAAVGSGDGIAAAAAGRAAAGGGVVKGVVMGCRTPSTVRPETREALETVNTVDGAKMSQDLDDAAVTADGSRLQVSDGKLEVAKYLDHTGAVKDIETAAANGARAAMVDVDLAATEGARKAKPQQQQQQGGSGVNVPGAVRSRKGIRRTAVGPLLGYMREKAEKEAAAAGVVHGA